MECGMPVIGCLENGATSLEGDVYKKTDPIKVVCPQCEEIIPPQSFCCPNCKLLVKNMDCLNNNPIKFPSKGAYLKELFKTLFCFITKPTATAPCLLRFRSGFMIFIMLLLLTVTSLFANNIYIARGLKLINPDSEFMKMLVDGFRNSYKPGLSECLSIMAILVSAFFVASFGVKKIEAFRNISILLFASLFVEIFYLSIVFVCWMMQVPVTSMLVLGTLFNIWSLIVSLYAISSIYSITKGRVFLSIFIPGLIVGFIVQFLLNVFASMLI